MTDQPETMVEYQFEKLRRVLIWATAMFGSILTASTAAVILSTDAALSTVFCGAAIGFWFIGMAVAGENACRRIFNRLAGSEITEIKRPEVAKTGGLTDD